MTERSSYDLPTTFLQPQGSAASLTFLTMATTFGCLQWQHLPERAGVHPLFLSVGAELGRDGR